ncbi:Hsp20/alpha crystallin family protein [Chloroflexota bacterium]
MAQFQRDWFTNLDSMQREVERLLGDFSGRKPPLVHFSPRGWEPAVDIYETPQEVVILVELAGMKQEEIEVVADHDTLIIRGERKDTSQRGKKSYHRMEIRWGAFERGILLPVAIKTDETRATYKDGLLEIVVPKAQKEKTHKIRVRPSEAGGGVA